MRYVSSGVPANEMKMTQLKVIVQYKMRGRETLPPKMNKANLLQRYYETINREDLFIEDYVAKVNNKNKAKRTASLTFLPSSVFCDDVVDVDEQKKCEKAEGEI